MMMMMMIVTLHLQRHISTSGAVRCLPLTLTWYGIISIISSSLPIPRRLHREGGGDVEVVPVAAAGDAVAGGRSSASSSLLVDSLWCHID